MVNNNPISQPTARTFTLVDLVESARIGKLRIPELQRPLRWQWPDVQRLFDSIVKGYPIGNLLLWSRPAPPGRIRLGALHIDAKEFQEGWWVVDGQQRLTSLANALTEGGSRDERFALAYDLEHREFVRPDPRNLSEYLVPLPILFNLDRLLRWFTKEHPDAADKLEEASRVTRLIREYQVPAYLVDHEDETVLREIFDRLNNYGKRLTRAEVFSALHPGQRADSEPFAPFERIAEEVHAETGFGLLDTHTVLRAVLARRGGNVTREIRVEFASEGEAAREARDFGDEDPAEAYRGGQEALVRAVRFLQQEAAIPHFAFLPYRYLVVVLTRFFAHFPDPHPRNVALLRRWFWRAATAGPMPFKGSWTNAMRLLATRISAGEEDASMHRLLAPPIPHRIALPPLEGFRTNAAASRIVLAAMWDLGPRSVLSGAPYAPGNLTEALAESGSLRGIARPILSSEPEHRQSAANRLFVLEEDLPSPLTELLTEPDLFRPDDWEGVLASHALDQDMLQALACSDRDVFLSARSGRIEAQVRAFLTRMAEPDFEDTPRLDSFDLDDEEAADGARDDELA